jgi:hypothetical protein
MYRLAGCVVFSAAATLCCALEAQEVVWEDTTYVEAWSLSLVEQMHGPAHSDAIRTDVFLVDGNGSRRLLVKDLIGPLVPLPNGKRIFSCEANSVMQTRGPLLVDLDGTTEALPQHPGYLRNCEAVGTGEQMLLHYNLIGSGGAYNLVRIFDSAGHMLLETRLESEGEIQFEVAGQVYRLAIPAPELPG